ncbi:MAG: SANT/Myb-like DNA-binding domain-containing protein, partial [Pseudomonadota bacterium]
EPADSSDDDVERRPARRAVHFADAVDGDALASTQPLVAPTSDASGSDDDSDKNDGRDGAVEHDDDDDEDYVEEEPCEAKANVKGPTSEHPPADDDAGWETCDSDVEEVEPKRRTYNRWTDDEHERLIKAVNRFGKQSRRLSAL